jgi:hypothetical protein
MDFLVSGGIFVVEHVQKNITTEIWDIFFFLSAFTKKYFRGDTEIFSDEHTLKSFPSNSLSSFTHCSFDLLHINGYILADIQPQYSLS